MKALLVEDDTGILGMLKRILADNHSIEVSCKRTLKEGLHEARVLQPNLIVVDLALLPDSSPENTIERGLPQFRDVAPKAAIMVYSGYLDYERRKLCFQFGADSVVEKSPHRPRQTFLLGIIEALNHRNESPALLIELVRGMLGAPKE